jgi:hypothetical protein
MKKCLKRHPSTQFELQADPNLKHEVQTFRVQESTNTISIDRDTMSLTTKRNCVEYEPEQVKSNIEDWIGTHVMI